MESSGCDAGRTAGIAGDRRRDFLGLGRGENEFFTCSGGSSSVFSRALNAPALSNVHLVDEVDLEGASGRA